MIFCELSHSCTLSAGNDKRVNTLKLLRFPYLYPFHSQSPQSCPIQEITSSFSTKFNKIHIIILKKKTPAMCSLKDPWRAKTPTAIATKWKRKRKRKKKRVWLRLWRLEKERKKEGQPLWSTIPRCKELHSKKKKKGKKKNWIFETVRRGDRNGIVKQYPGDFGRHKLETVIMGPRNLLLHRLYSFYFFFYGVWRMRTMRSLSQECISLQIGK